MKHTDNYNLRKPEGTDLVNIEDLNTNMDIIDEKIQVVTQAEYDNLTPLDNTFYFIKEV